VLSRQKRRLAAILLTHHHGDHVGGVGEILAEHPAPVFGPSREKIPPVDRPVSGGDVASIPELHLEFEVLDVPGHTAGHVAYTTHGAALVGDTLFAGGCGRVFEGTAEQMFGSLTALAGLPEETLAYCAHEYTLANLRFALEVEPGNEALRRRLEEAEMTREVGRPTVPSTLRLELDTNPFLRCRMPEVVAAAQDFAGRRLTAGVDTFAVIRGWKDGWRG
jgi:hydroxyacylglutathione hydrolase